MRRFRTLVIPEHVNPKVRWLFEEMNRQQIGTRDLADRSGVSHNTIDQWKFRRSPQHEHLEAVINALGYELVIRETWNAS